MSQNHLDLLMLAWLAVTAWGFALSAWVFVAPERAGLFVRIFIAVCRGLFGLLF